MASHTPASLKALLNQRGFRLTPQRQTILHIFQTLPQGNHLSAEELHNILVAQGERISLSTVYRTLHVMAFMGVLRELELAEGHKHYELNSPDPHQHHHLVCVQCNRTLEFESDLIDRIGTKQAEAEGYHLLDCQLTIYIVCPDAMQQGWSHSLPRDWVCNRMMQMRPDPE
ncbi:MAG: transcriptional repressor [Pegethrix bostrychoides GSE-TBD4-15B]|jgi:Fur family ferric uptake transcriptional regulator|uniref:Ferric uptake regulation protein n=1 Tax=Pegethrix bostrychoides GSE-TBD4-15B TaxID=2839662 RepID=A0A951PBI7_9CYAN|nr:transcriptional repressor [Pegethrix bostrychoides GSE-TBD4-15B]